MSDDEIDRLVKQQLDMLGVGEEGTSDAVGTELPTASTLEPRP
jgi:hypothetical protein